MYVFKGSGKWGKRGVQGRGENKEAGKRGGLHPQPRAQNKIVALEKPSRTRYLGAQLCNYKTVLTYTNKQWGGGGRRAIWRKKPICLKRQA